jgi:hypothetical protein
MHEVEFIPAEWLERSLWAAMHGQTLLCYSRPLMVERRIQTRRTADVALLIQSVLLAKAA